MASERLTISEKDRIAKSIIKPIVEQSRKEFEDCLIEECQEKQSNLDTCYGAVNNQNMYLCGVLATAYELFGMVKNFISLYLMKFLIRKDK